MNHYFVPYELAVKLKELGFDEECLGYSYSNMKNGDLYLVTSEFKISDEFRQYYIKRPLWQQAFDWLLPQLPNYNLDQMENTFDLRFYDGKEWSYIIMLGTREDCLKKLIAIAYDK